MVMGDGLVLEESANIGDEIINNDRCLAYADALGVGWLHNCEDCDIDLPGALDFTTPKEDGVPWYDPRFPATAGFCGIFGVDVTGIEDNTYTATVTRSLTRGGVIGPRYPAPREFVIRGLAVADSESALQEGFNWFKRRASQRGVECAPMWLSFFYACPPMECRPEEALDPCPCESTSYPPCWVDTYGQLKGAGCSSWWPDTYAQLKDGPPDESVWCHWVYEYYELRIGADQWSCAMEDCVVPYLWQFYDAAVSEGPKVIDHRELSVGGYIEFEMTITTGDPFPHRIHPHVLA